MCVVLTHAGAQTVFSLATLNVDGLPGQIMMFNVNQEGPKSAGSELISEYLAGKGCDIICMQEDFNYRWEIWSRLFAGYEHDEWTGGLILEDEKVDNFHLQNMKFRCDGLNMAWKKGIQTKNYERKAWHRSFGKFSHDFDDMITKGYRRHELTLENGYEVVVYNMHMDASSDRDEKKNNDVMDRQARLSQWIQLRDDILDHLDTRPVIVAGDMNSLYHRDDVKAAFIDAINATGRATVGDVWIEKHNAGVYPTLGGEPLAGETLDKILYVNPTEGGAITPVTVTLDTVGYKVNGRPLGDHYPLMATFEFGRKGSSAHIAGAEPETAPPAVYDLKGIRRNGDSRDEGILIIDGKKVSTKRSGH